MIEIIDYKDEYREQFKSLNLDWIQNYFTVEPADEYVLSDPQTAILDQGGVIFFAKGNNRILGTCALLKIDEKTFELAKMAVSEMYRNIGIGRMLMDKVLRKAKEMRLHKVVLYSNTDLIPALKLYFSYGFRVVPIDDHPTKRANVKLELIIN